MPKAELHGERAPRPSFMHVLIVGLLVLCTLFLGFFLISNRQSKDPTMPRIRFVGQYRIGNGPWCEVSEGEHIPADKGAVTLKGYFSMPDLQGEDGEERVPADTQISLCLSHVFFTARFPSGEEIVFETEHEALGADACGEMWTSMQAGLQAGETVELTVINPHRFGNAGAVDKLLESMYVYSAPYFEKMAGGFGRLERTVGLVAVVTAFIVLGIALFSALLHTGSDIDLKLIGLLILFGGAYFVFSSEAVYFWNDIIVLNTLGKGLSGMLYIFFAFCITQSCLKGRGRRVAVFAVCACTVVCAGCMIASFFGVRFYDTLLWWAAACSLLSLMLIVLLFIGFRRTDTVEKTIRLLCALTLLCFLIDVTGTWFGWWQGGFLSRYAFVLIFAMQLVIVLQIIPRNINSAMRAKRLEAEKHALHAQLAESRISTMISQIRPHFIYNTLGSIEQLCELDPPKAAQLVHNFARYLRGNFGELDNPRPIRMSREMEHVKHYISIENVRFPDMVFTFEMNSGDFDLPALTVQPVIENAIKHGLMKLDRGGTIKVTSFETDTHYCVRVEDNGVGFDTGILLDERKHIGLRNIRGRLEAMVGGTLEIESEIGVGTTVNIMIPKEYKK